MAKALIDSGHKGTVNTIDIIPNKKIYWNCISDAEGKKTRLELLNSWRKELQYINFIEGTTSRQMRKLKFEKIDFAFLDAQHDKESVIEEYNFVKRHQTRGDIIIFDDVSKKFNEIMEAIDLIKKEITIIFLYSNFLMRKGDMQLQKNYKKNLGVFFSNNTSLDDWSRKGFINREISYYKKLAYKKN